MSDQSLLLLLTELDAAVVFDVAAFTGGAVEVALRDPSLSWDGAVVAAERSLGGVNYKALEPDPVVFSADDTSWRLDLTGVSKLRLRVTTPASGASGYPVIVGTVHGIPGT